jgi:UDP-N-acetylmuramoyl-L-alanyl-D-glutamate--2,6-diaminopimelate ligase
LAEGQVVGDRATAIEAAINLAQPGDGILIAGKGHEDYQILGTEKIHFDDREQARHFLEKRYLA